MTQKPGCQVIHKVSLWTKTVKRWNRESSKFKVPLIRMETAFSKSVYKVIS